jgi:wyosine [tRNA(Phe)-imidazoG37] synthetase (radical SAM superfamily)
MIAFGPVPSRRLGYSLGINHIPPKHCPYSCVYCQVGRTSRLEISRHNFYTLSQILREVKHKITESLKVGRKIDYLTLVPDGEPMLDSNLGKLIGALKPFEIPVAVISNASLIDREEIQSELLQADWVSLKVDTVDETAWRQINRPHRHLSLSAILNGMLDFRRKFAGELVTETMLVSGINDSDTNVDQLCAFLLQLQPLKSYLSIPTRPPAESWVTPPAPDILQNTIEIVSRKIPFLELLFETEIGDFLSTGDISEDILSITAVHPLSEKALRHMVSCAGADWSIVQELLSSSKITCIQYRGERFFCSSFRRSSQ